VELAAVLAAAGLAEVPVLAQPVAALTTTPANTADAISTHVRTDASRAAGRAQATESCMDCRGKSCSDHPVTSLTGQNIPGGFIVGGLRSPSRASMCWTCRRTTRPPLRRRSGRPNEPPTAAVPVVCPIGGVGEGQGSHSRTGLFGP
jgi:hypothetical protein